MPSSINSKYYFVHVNNKMIDLTINNNEKTDWDRTPKCIFYSYFPFALLSLV